MKIESKEQAISTLNELKQQVTEIETWLKNNEISSNKFNEMEKLFLKLINNLRLEIDNKNQKVIFYNSNNEWIIEQDIKSKKIWFSYRKFWLKFEIEFQLNYDKIQLFTGDMVNKHFDWKEYTTCCLWSSID